MDRVKGLWKQIRVLLRKDEVEGDLDQEIAFHLEMETERNLRAGMSPAAARRAARLAFGGTERTKEEVRDARWVRRLENALSDIRYGLRMLRKRPGFAAVAIVTMALGIGGTTAVFSVVRGVLIEPLPYESPGQLVRLYQVDAEEPEDELFVTGAHFMDYRDRASSFEALASVYTYNEVGADLTLGDRPQRIRALPVSAGYFRVLGEEPLVGRGFTRAEETGAPVVVFSEELWRRAGLGERAVGSTVVLDGEPHTVVGVIRGGFRDPLVGVVDAWVPQDLSSQRAQFPGNHFLSVLGRLAPGVTPAQARQEMQVLDAALAEKYPEVADDAGFRLVPLREDLVAGTRPTLLLVLGAALLVLLVACVNLANLLMVRSLERAREAALRSTLGAGAGRIAMQLLTESTVLSVAGGVAGIGVAVAGLRGLLYVGSSAIPRIGEVGIDGAVLGSALGATLLTGWIAGILPALRLARTPPVECLGEASRTATGDRSHVRLRRVLVAAQVGLALTLLVGASTLAASVHRLSRVDLGFRPERALTFELHLPESRYDSASRAAFHRRMPEALAGLPGVEAVGAITALPATGTHYDWGTRPLTGPLVGTERGFVGADQRIVSGEIFEALGIPLVEGRLLDERDRAGEEPAVVVSDSLAEELFPGTTALGQTLRMGGVERKVVGVVANVARDPEGRPVHHVYHPHDQFAERHWALRYVLAAKSDPSGLLPAVRSTVAAVDPQLVVHRPQILEEVVERGRSRRRFALALTGSFALLALILAALGLYGVLAYGVRQRRREIGVRVAMGAGAGRVAGLVVREGLAVTGAGLIVGTLGAFALENMLASLVFDTAPTEPRVLAAAAFALSCAAGAATVLPTWRALRISPRIALTEE